MPMGLAMNVGQHFMRGLLINPGLTIIHLTLAFDNIVQANRQAYFVLI